jgi:hypothetical protein
MCGIWGVVGRNRNGLFHYHGEIISDMVIAGALRGSDGTGVFAVDRHNPKSVVRLKRGSNPYNLVSDAKWKDFHSFATLSGRFVVGHNRKATVGAISDANAHPFQQGPITLVHNGAVFGIPKPESVEVDSHAFTIALAEEGLDVFTKISGAWTFVWHDQRDGLLHIAKNGQRPLSALWHGGDLYFASEWPMLQWLLMRNNQWDSNKAKPLELHNMQHYILDLEGDTKVRQEALPEKKHFPVTEWPRYGGGGSEGTHPKGHGGHGGTTRRKHKTKTKGEWVDSFVITEHEKDESAPGFFIYIGISDEHEGIWFRTNTELDYMGKAYSGRIAGYSVGGIEKYGDKAVWYRLHAKSVTEIDLDDENSLDALQSDGVSDDNKEFKFDDGFITPIGDLIDAVKKGCIACFAKLELETLEKCEAVPKKAPFRLMCPACAVDSHSRIRTAH